MAEYGNRYTGGAVAGTRTRADMDEGLRKYMLNVYNYMGLGIAFCAVVALGVMQIEGAVYALAGGGMWVLFIGVMALGWFSPRLMMSGNAVVAHAAYWTYCALWGALIAPMIFSFLQAGAGDLVVRAFAITAVTFGAVSLYGYTTKRDLSGFAQFFFMASIGLLVAILVNVIFFQLEMMSLITSSLVVILFSGVTAYETQMIKRMYIQGDVPGAQNGKAIFGAFMLFGSFITLFIHILNILGIMSGD